MLWGENQPILISTDSSGVKRYAHSNFVRRRAFCVCVCVLKRIEVVVRCNAESRISEHLKYSISIFNT